MSASWFRSWHGAPTDPKWRTIARRAGVRPGDVAAIVWTLLDRASQAEDRGSIAGYDIEVIADALGYESNEVDEVLLALHEKGVLKNDRFCGWEKHQPAREDGSAERAKAWRERKKAEKSTSDRSRTQPNATERNQPLDTDTDTDNGAGANARGMRALMVSAMGPLAWCAERHSKFHVLSEPVHWITSGCDLEADILPAIKAKCLSMQQRGDEPRGWKIFTEAVFEARDRRLAPPPPVQQRAASPPSRSNGRQDPFAAMERIAAREREKAEIDSRAVEFLPADRG